MSDFTDRLVVIARAERDRFGNGESKEWMDDVFERVGDYWTRLAEIPAFAHWAGTNGKSEIKFDAKGNPKKDGNRNPPWSAAFISFVMAEAEAGDAFSYSSSHSTYIVRALREAAKKKSTAKFIARRHKQYSPKVGDLIACERQKKIDPNFDTYIDFVAEGKFEAHCDIVTEVHEKSVVTIGGNVSSSVMEKRWPLDKDGHIGNHDPGNSQATVICVIETLL